MSKELTNRQLAEAVGYALEKAESNLNASVKKLEEERKRIETVVIDNKKKDYSKPTTNNSSIKVDDGLDDLGL